MSKKERIIMYSLLLIMIIFASGATIYKQNKLKSAKNQTENKIQTQDTKNAPTINNDDLGDIEFLD